MVSRSVQPRKQRRAVFRASLFERHRRMAVALSRELRTRYGRRRVPLRKGDTVRVVAGSYKGREERVAKVDLRGYGVTLDNVTVKKVDQKLKPLPIRPAQLILTKLNLADPWRRRILRVTAAEAPAEEAAADESAPAPPGAGTPEPVEGSAPAEPAPPEMGTGQPKPEVAPKPRQRRKESEETP